MGDAEDNENYQHHGEGNRQHEMSNVEAPESWTAEEWSILVAWPNQAPCSDAELITRHEAKQTSDDCEINSYHFLSFWVDFEYSSDEEAYPSAYLCRISVHSTEPEG